MRYLRTEPLILNSVEPQDLEKIKTFLYEHGATMQTFGNETHAIYFPTGTQEEVKNRSKDVINYMLYFPDGGIAGWFHQVASQQAGVPYSNKTGFSIPEETEPR